MEAPRVKLDKEQVSALVVQRMATPQSGDLNSWATWAYFRAAGGSGFPSWEDCHGRTHRTGVLVADPPLLTQAELDALASVQLCDDSGRFYDGTPKKYEPSAKRQKVDPRVLESVVKVENALRRTAAPPFLRSYLCWLYPQWGKYVPVRVPGWRDDPLKTFLDTEAAMRHLLGNRRNYYLDRNAMGLIGNLMKELKRELDAR